MPKTSSVVLRYNHHKWNLFLHCLPKFHYRPDVHICLSIYIKPIKCPQHKTVRNKPFNCLKLKNKYGNSVTHFQRYSYTWGNKQTVLSVNEVLSQFICVETPSKYMNGNVPLRTVYIRTRYFPIRWVYLHLLLAYMEQFATDLSKICRRQPFSEYTQQNPSTRIT